MTGDEQRHAVACAGSCDRPRRPRTAEPARHFRVRPGLAARDGAQLLPDAMLEGRRLDVQGKVGPRLRARELVQDQGHPALEAGIVAVDLGLRVLLAQAGFQRRLRIAEAHRGHAPVRRRHQQPSQRRVRHRVADRHAAPAPAIGRGGHAQAALHVFVEPAARPEADVVHCSRHGISSPQPSLEGGHAAGVRVLPRGDAERVLERAQQMARAHPDLLRQRAQAPGLIAILREQPAGCGHHGGASVGGAGLARTAAAAGAEAGRLRRTRPGEERDVPAPGPPRRA